MKGRYHTRKLLAKGVGKPIALKNNRCPRNGCDAFHFNTPKRKQCTRRGIVQDAGESESALELPARPPANVPGRDTCPQTDAQLRHRAHTCISTFPRMAVDGVVRLRPSVGTHLCCGQTRSCGTVSTLALTSSKRSIDSSAFFTCSTRASSTEGCTIPASRSGTISSLASALSWTRDR